MYVGMSGRSLTKADVLAHRESAAKGKGLYSRLSSHAAGRRSGDQFCVYVCDRLVLPTLDAETIARIGHGTSSLDALVRTYIHTHLCYRFVEVEDGVTALMTEAIIRRGMLRAGKPVLNPVK